MGICIVFLLCFLEARRHYHLGSLHTLEQHVLGSVFKELRKRHTVEFQLSKTQELIIAER